MSSEDQLRVLRSRVEESIKDLAVAQKTLYYTRHNNYNGFAPSHFGRDCISELAERIIEDTSESLRRALEYPNPVSFLPDL